VTDLAALDPLRQCLVVVRHAWDQLYELDSAAGGRRSALREAAEVCGGAVDAIERAVAEQSEFTGAA
jgi:hypothetical protein